MNPIHVNLPLPPSANVYWRIARGRAVPSKEADKFKAMAAMLAKSEMGGRPLILGPVAVSLAVYFPTKAGDLDNRIKVTLDALQGIVFKNDAQVEEIHAVRFMDRANPRVRVVVDPREWAPRATNIRVARDGSERVASGKPLRLVPASYRPPDAT